MKKKIVRLISAVLSAVMTLTAVPLSAFAEGEEHTHDGESNVITAPLDFREKKADENGVGWSWVYGTKTLTLDGVNIQATTEENMMSVVTVPDGTEIVLNGNNTIVQTNTGDSDTYVLSAVNTNDVNCDGTMTISGDGVLNAENRSTDSMARSLGGSIILNGGTVNATGTVKTNSLEIHNDGKLNANATTASFEGVAVNVSGGITVDGNGSLTAVGCANESTLNSAILLTSNFDKISVSGNGSITVPESNKARVGIYYSGNNGDGMDAEISGGKVTAYGTKYGICKVNLIMSGTGSVYTTGGSYAIGQTVPTIDEDRFTVKGSTEFKASESAVTGEVKIPDGYYYIGEADAKTVVIKPDTEPSIKLGKQIGAIYADENGNASTAYFYITAKNFADGAFSPEAEWVTSPGSANIDANITKTGGEYVCEVICDEPDLSRQYELRVKSGEVYSNTVTVTVGKPHFALTSRDSQSKYYTNYNGEQKITLRYDVEAGYENQDGLQYNWSSDSKKYDIADLGTVTTVDGVETLVFSDNVPEGSYVIYCDVVYNNDNGEAYTLTERFAFTFEECKHTGGFTDEVCNICHNACDHKNIDTDTGICVCGHQFVATISTDGSAPTGYDTLADCLNSITADTGNYVKIYQDIEEDSSQEYIVKYRVTLDLNGHRLDDKLNINEKNSTDNSGELTLTGTGYINNVYAYSNTTFTIDDNANIEADTFFNNAGTRFTVSDGANVTVRYLAVKESLSNEGNATSVKLATGMKITEMLAYDRDISSPLSENIMLKNLLSDNQMLKYESSSKIIDLYYGASRIIINSKTYGYGTITVVEHTDADHKYSDGTGKCEECGKPCEHGGDINTDTGICSICGAVVSVAIYTDANGISKYVDTDELHSLLNEYGKSGTVKLFKDYYKIEQHDIDGVITIDLNGHDFTVRGVTPWSGGKVTFKNSGSEQVTCSGSVSPTVDAPGGTLIVDGDIYFDSAININDYGTVILNAGKYVDLTIKGDRTLCDMLGEGKAFYNSDGTVFNAKVQAGSDLTVKAHSHTYVDGKCDCGYVCPHSNIDINTGKCTECEYQYSAVIVKDGAVAFVYKETEMEAAFQAADSGVNTGCTLRVYKNYTGSYTTLSGKFTLWIAEKANVGALTVSGDITVTGSEKSNRIYGDFNVAAGGKLTFDENCGAMGTVSVGAGTFDCYYSIDITLNINDASSDVILHGGTFRKICYNGGGDRANAEILTLLAENRIFMKTYGELVDGSKTLLKDGFATPVIVIRHEDHSYDSTTGKCTICGKRCGHTDVDSKTGVCSTCKYQLTAGISGVGTAKYFDNIDDAFSAALSEVNSGCTLTLYKNCEITQNVEIGNTTVTVDVNGYLLGEDKNIVVNSGGILCLKDSRKSTNSGCVNAPLFVNGGTFINGTADGSSSAADVLAITIISAKRVEIYGGIFENVYIAHASGVVLYGGRYNTICGEESNSTPVNTLLAKGYAFATLNSVTHLPESIVDGSAKTIGGRLTNVTVVKHTHTYNETNTKCACGAVLYAKVTSADGTTNEYFDSIEEGLLYADKAENKGCVFTLVTSGKIKDYVTLSNGQFTITAMNNNCVISASGGKICIEGADVIAEGHMLINCSIDMISGSLTLPEGSGTRFGTIIISGGTVNISEGVNADNNAGADKLFIANATTDAKVTIGGGTYGNVAFEMLKLKDVLASGVRVIRYDNSSDPTAEKIVTALLYSDIAEESYLAPGDDDGRYYLFTKCEHKNEDGSYAFNDSGICKYCNSEFAASVSYTVDGSAKTELFGDIYDAFDKANEAGTATVTLYKDITDSERTRDVTVMGNVTLELNGKTLGGRYGIARISVSDGGTLTVNGDGDMDTPIYVNENSKLVINGGGYFNSVSVKKGGNAEIGGGTIQGLSVRGNVKLSGGKFNDIEIFNGNLESVLADGYAYKVEDGTWLSIAERAESVYSSLNNNDKPLSVEEAPIKSASIAWVGEEAPVIYRNGEKYLYVDITYELAVGSRGATYSDFVNGNNRIKDYNLYNKYMVHCYEIGKLAAKDGEVEYYIVLKCNGYEYKSNVLKLTLATCSHPEDSFSYENDGLVICGICDALIEAEVVDADGKSLGYADIESAIKLAQENEGSTVKLMSEGVSESITVTGGRFTVDFNGKKVFYQFDVNGGDVTFTSSVKQADVETLISGITVNGTDAKVTIDGKIKLGSVTLTSGALAVNSTDGYIKELSINGGATVINGANIDALKTYGGDTVINDVNADSLTMCDNRSGGSEYNISIVSGMFGSFTCENGSNYTLGRAIASGSVVSADSMNGITVYTYEAIQTMTSTYRIFVDKCNHKDKNGSYVLDGNPCPYCNEEIVATVSYTENGGEKTELFGDIYDAFERANEIGTATITLCRDIADSEIAHEINVTGNVTLALNGKTLGATDKAKKIYICGSTLTVNGNGKVWSAIEAKPDSKLTITNGEYYDVYALSDSEVVILDGIIDCLSVYGTGKAEVSGGKFKYLYMYNGKAIESVLADGYAYKNADGTWLSIDKREKDSYLGGSDGALSVEEAPIKSASIAWYGGGTPVVYRNGAKNLDVNITYELADASKQITYSDYVNGNNHSKDSEFSDNWYTVFGYEIGDIITEDGEVEYYTVLKCDGYEYKSNVLKLTLATCSHPEDSFTEKNNDGGVFCGICDLLIGAQVIKADGEPLGYADIESAIKLAQENEGSTVKLISERVPASITVTGGKFTVDFNGKEVYYNSDVKGGDVTFTSSVKQADAENLLSTINVNGADAKVTIDGKIKLGRVRTLSGTLTVNSTDGYIGELSIEGAKTDVDGARIGALRTFGGEAVIKNVTADSLAMFDNRSGGSEYNVSIVSGMFGSFTCENGSNYTLGRAIASGSVVSADSMNGITVYTYEAIQTMTSTYRIFVDKCNHKDKNGSYVLDGNPCPYCNEEIVATVSYTANGSEETDLFSDIYDAFAKANEIGTATVTLQKNITDDITDTIAVTGNVTLELNGKKLSTPGFDPYYTIEVKSGKLTVNGSGTIKCAVVRNGGDAEINGGIFSDFRIEDGGNAVINGGKFNSIKVSGEGRNVGQLLADGYAYKNFDGFWSTVAEREKRDIASVNVLEAPIKSATITAEDESPIIYRNGNNSVDYTANVTYSGNETLYVTGCLIDGTVIKEKTELLNGRCRLGSREVADVVAEDGEIQYYCIFTYDGYDYKSNVVTLTVATCQHPVESVKCDDNGCVCGICNRALPASVELSDGTLSYYGNWNDAISAAQESEGCTLKLLNYSWLKDNETFDISKGRFTVDLNKNDGNTAFAFDVKGGDITFTALKKASISFTGVTVSGENANVLIDSKATLNYLVVNSGKVTVDGAYISTITIKGGDMVINDVDTGLLSEEGNGSVNISIVSGRFENVVFDEYTFGKAIASGSRIRLTDADGGKIYKYADIQNKGNAGVIVVEKCDHKDENDSYALDGNPCPYCNEEIVATVSYTADGSEQTDLFSDIYDAFDKANEAGTATVTLYKDITNSELTQGVTITGNVTFALNGKKLGGTFAFNAPVEVSDGGMFTVGGDGKMRMPIKAYANSKLIINGGEFTSVMVYIDGDAEIGGGVIDALTIIGNAKAKISGGKFYNIEIANGSLESVLADGYAYKKDGGVWLSIAERAESVYSSVNNDNKPVNVEEAPIKSATLSTEINKLYRNSNANPTLKFNLALAHGSNLNDSYVSKRYGINSYVSGDIIYSSLSALVKDAKLSADEIIDKAGDSDVAEIYYVVTTGDGYEIKSNTVSIDLVDCDHSQVVDPTADKETAGNITTPTYCEICKSKFNAKITKGDDVKYYNDLDEAAKDAQKSENEGCTLYPLYNKNGYGGQLVITEGNFTLKYAVRTAFSRPIIINGKAKLTVTGRCAVTAFENQDAFIVRGGDVTFDGLATGSNVTINGGNVTMASNNINCLTINGGNVSISSGGFAEIVTTVSDKVIADYIDPDFWVQDRGTKEWIDIYSLNKATASSTSGLTVRVCPMQIIKPIDTVYYTNGYYPGDIPSLQISAVPWYSGEVDAKVAYQWIGIDENGYETEIEGATDRKLSLENLTTGRYYCRITYSNATTAGVSMKSDVVTATITECEHSGGEATCTNKAKCEICGAEYGETKPHSYAQIKSPEYLKSAATCTAKAVYYMSCADCGQSSKGTKNEATFEYGNALGHKYGEWVSNGDGTHTRVCANDSTHTETKACHGGKATCTAKAICEDCGKAYGEMAAHTFTAKSTVSRYLKRAATCTEKSEYYVSCAGCGLSSKGTASEAVFTGSALGHSLTEWSVITEVTCTTNGTQERHCTRCDYKQTRTIVAKGHSYGLWNVTKKVGCITDGEQSRECSVCGNKETKAIAATGVHSYGSWKVAKAATCTTTGTKVRSCLECGVKETVIIQPTGHKYVESIVKPTYTEKGYILHKCSECGTSYKSSYTDKLVLASVSGVKLAGRAADALRVSWNRNTSADGYIVEIYKDGAWARAGKITTDSTTDFKVTGLKASTFYKFRVRAYKMSGNTAVYSDYGTTLTARTNPSVITGAKLAGRAADALRISWDRNTSADGYIVEIYKDGAWSRAVKTTNNSITTYRAEGLKASTVYKLRVRAYKMDGTAAYYGNYSAEVTARTNPSVIKGAKLAGRAADALRISWERNTSADGYIVEVYKDGAWARAGKITTDSTTDFRVTGLKASTVYKLRVRAYKMSGTAAYYGNYSAEVTARTNPSVMTGVKIGGTAKDALRINWSKNTSAQGYIVEMAQNGEWVRVAKITDNSTTTFRKAGLAKNTSYRFRVCAYHMSGSTPLYGTYVSVSGKTAAN